MSADAARKDGSWAIASPHAAATEAAATVLSDGGTAVDAAICAAGVLTVVYPHNCSVGGDLIGLVRHGMRPPKVVYGVGRAASGADPAALRREHGDKMPTVGPLSITVPGVVSGWIAMHELGGTLPFTRLLEPAVEIASDGVLVSPSVAAALGELESDDAGMSQVFGPPAERLGEGDVLLQPRLAETIAQIGKDPDGYYHGDLAERLVAGLASGGSPLGLADFHQHRAMVADAVETACGRLAPRMFTADLPSQGAFFGDLVTAVGQLVEAGHDLTGGDGHLLARVFGSFARLRDELLCDPTRSPGRRALQERLDQLRHSADDSPPPAGRRGRVFPGKAAAPSGDTVAVVARDGTGMSVSMLQSVFHSFGSKFLDPETGVLFHNRGAMFTLEPGAPAQLGPGLRPPHTLCPVMVDGVPEGASLVLSTMGARGQPQILAEVLVALVAGSGLAEALAAPRIVVGGIETRGSSRLVTAEEDVRPELLASLVADGFDVARVSRLNELTGHAQALSVGTDEQLQAASDPRSDGTAISWP